MLQENMSIYVADCVALQSVNVDQPPRLRRVFGSVTLDRNAPRPLTLAPAETFFGPLLVTRRTA